MSGSLTQFGMLKEVTFGTAIAVTKPFEILKEDLRGMYPRVQAEALSANLVDRSDRFMISDHGAAGSIDIEPLSKGFGPWLEQMQGTVATTGPTETTVYTHTGTVGNLFGKSFTAQVGRAQTDGTVKPWTYEGGKVTGYEFSNQADQTLRCSISADFEKESQPASPAGAYVLATLTQVSGAEVLSWQGGTITIGGTDYDVLEASVKVDNAINADRYFIRRGTSKKQQIQDGKRKIEFSVRVPYDDSVLWQKVSSATLAGAYATFTAKWEGLTLLGSTLYPGLTISIPVARFDEGGPVVDGPGLLEQTFTGTGLYDGTNSAISLVYKSADVTP